MRLLSHRALGFGTLLVVVALLPSCGGGGGEGSERTMQFGPLTTRIAGTVQPPVTSGEYGVVVTGVAGANITALTLQDASPTLADSRIAFVSNRVGNHEIYTMKVDGSEVTRLTNNAFSDSSPYWSPDGTKIVFESWRDGNAEIYTMNSDGSGQVRVTNNAGEDNDPVWSPDGTKIAFHSNRDGNGEVYSMNADGSGVTRLTNHASGDYYPYWSPDGTKIAFASYRDGNAEIYTMNSNGGGQSRLTNNADPDIDPSWSPDGTKIAFTNVREGNYEIYQMNADGSGQTRLTDNLSVDYGSSWSPDGTKIAFERVRDDNTEIYTMNANGTGQANLTNSAETETNAAWGPFLARRTLVGAGGSMGANAAGFLFGRGGDTSHSLVVFDAVTRSAARVKAQTGLGDGLPTVVFNISADSINRLSYINFDDTVQKVVTVVGPGAAIATATDALVDFNSSTGRVSAVLPYTANRSAAPTFSLENGARVIRGRFLGAWDGKGKNRAPNGASEVRLDAKTGEIVGVK